VEEYDRIVGEAEATIAECETPTLGMIHGTCMGGGALIALACSMRFADIQLRFAIPASRLGTVYPATTIARLVQLVGPSVAFDLAASARVVESDEAFRVGLVSLITPKDELQATVMQYAEELCQRAPLSVRAAQLAVRAAVDPADLQAQAALRSLQRAASESEDYLEGIDSFIQKRRPRFSGR
jgi:enoyl-CoA hydratase/carnithine racemase